MTTAPLWSPAQSEDEYEIPEIPKEERFRLALCRFEAQGGKKGPESMTSIAKQYGLNKKTFIDRVNGSVSKQQHSENMQKLGRHEEQAITEWVKQLQAWNWPPRVEKVRSIANELLRAKGISEPIGINWASKFLARFPELKTIYVPPIDKSRVDAQDPAIFSDWFQLFWALKTEYKIEDSNIWNMDEKGFMQGVIAKVKVMISKYETKAHMSQPGNREWVSIIECISATGRKLKPWIIFKGCLQQKAWWNELGEGHICLSENGYTDNELGLAWFTEAFHPETLPPQDPRAETAETLPAQDPEAENAETLPAQDPEAENAEKAEKQPWRMLIVDGHASHITTAVIRFCVTQKIILLCLPAHTTHILQPLDVGVFAPLANAYKKQVHTNSAYGAAASIEKHEFIRFFKLAREEAISPTNIQKAWQKAGLLPFHPDLIIQKFLPVAPTANSGENLPGQVIWNITFRPRTPPETTISYSSSHRELVTPGNIQEVREIMREYQNNTEIPIEQKQYAQKVANAAEKFIASTQIYTALNDELVELQKRKKQANRPRGNYGAARVMDETVLQDRLQWHKEQEWNQEAKLLGRMNPSIFAPRRSQAPRVPKTPKTPRKRAPKASRARPIQFRLPPQSPQHAGSPQAGQATPEARAGHTGQALPATPRARAPRARARKKRLIVTLGIRVSTQALEQGKQSKQGRQGQQQGQEQGQEQGHTGRVLRIRKASTRT